MKALLRNIVSAAVVVLVASSALAGPPVMGIYKTQDGDVDAGRLTESWVNQGDYLTAGNANHGLSWDGATLGVQWRISCPELDGAVLVFDNVNATGNGFEIWTKTFSGGALGLNGTGEAWDGGDASYTGTIDSYSETVTIQYANFVRTGATANVTITGSFDQATCFSWQANQAEVGNTEDDGNVPADYPASLDGNCASRNLGSWWLHNDITLIINACAVPTEDASWGQIKARYDD